MAKNYYDILGVKKDSDAQDIKNAYVTKVIDAQFNGGMSTADNNDIAEAYQVLSDANMKQQYDQQGSNFNSDNKMKFKTGDELYNEKSKDPNFYQVSKSYTYKSTEKHSYEGDKHFAEKHSI